MKHNRVILSIGLISFAVLLIVLNLTSPSDIGAAGVLFLFVIFYIFIFSMVCLLWMLYYRLALSRTVFRVKDYLYAAVLSFAPIMLLIARSFSAINVWVLCLIALFTFLAEFLVAKKV